MLRGASPTLENAPAKTPEAGEIEGSREEEEEARASRTIRLRGEIVSLQPVWARNDTEANATLENESLFSEGNNVDICRREEQEWRHFYRGWILPKSPHTAVNMHMLEEG